MKTNWNSINPVTQNVIMIANGAANIFQLQKRVRRALRNSAEYRKVIDRCSKAPEAPKPITRSFVVREKRRLLRLNAATYGLKLCNQVLGGALTYCQYHNLPVDGQDVPTPFRPHPALAKANRNLSLAA